MNMYVKVPPHVAKMLGLTSRPSTKLPDGNYVSLVTIFRDKGICQPYEIVEKAPLMGCAMLTPLQLRYEREGRLVTPLPEPMLEEFKAPQEEAAPQPQPQPKEEPVVEVIEVVEEVIEETEEEEGGVE